MLCLEAVGNSKHTQVPRPGMPGPIWDSYVALAHALAGSDHRVVWLHPSSQVDLKCMSDDSAGGRYARWYAFRATGMSQQLRVVYPTLGPRKYPRGPQPQTGYDEARARLLGGRSTGGLSLWVRPSASAGASASGTALAVAPAPPLAPADDNVGGPQAHVRLRWRWLRHLPPALLWRLQLHLLHRRRHYLQRFQLLLGLFLFSGCCADEGLFVWVWVAALEGEISGAT